MQTQAPLILNAKIFISGVLTTLTGLHVGGNSTEMGIGGADKVVIRDPLTNRPYIPGSSLRGKMRSLLEKTTGAMRITVTTKDNVELPYNRVEDINIAVDRIGKIIAGPSVDKDSEAARLFGIAVDAQKELNIPIPQRLVVRDAKLLDESAKALEKAPNTDMPFTEVKTEVAIDRISSTANPRQIERVPAGARFGFEFVLNLYDGDQEKEYLELLFQCMELLQDDYLGGHGSRGYGRMAFHVEKVTKKTADDYRSNKSAREMNIEIPVNLKVCQ